MTVARITETPLTPQEIAEMYGMSKSRTKVIMRWAQEAIDRRAAQLPKAPAAPEFARKPRARHK